MGVEFGPVNFAQNTYCDFQKAQYKIMDCFHKRLAQVVTFHYLSPSYTVQFFMFMVGAQVGCRNN